MGVVRKHVPVLALLNAGDLQALEGDRDHEVRSEGAVSQGAHHDLDLDRQDKQRNGMRENGKRLLVLTSLIGLVWRYVGPDGRVKQLFKFYENIGLICISSLGQFLELFELCSSRH